MAQNRDVEFLIKVRADLQQALGQINALNGKLQDSGAHAERAFGRMGKGLDRLKGALAGLAIGAGFSAILKQAIEAEDAMRQLDARIKATGSTAGLGRDALIELSQSLAKITTFSDEAITGAEALMLTFDRVRGPVFKGAIIAALNLSKALGEDLQSAVMKVGKALQNPIEGLTAIEHATGKFTQTQKDQIRALVEAGRLQDAQALILKRFGNVAGTAEAAANTFGGALENLKKGVGKLFEGKDGGLKGATAAVKELTATLNDPQVKSGFDALVAGLVSATEWSARGAAAIAGLTKAAIDTFRASSDLDYDALLARRAALLDRIANYESSAWRMRFVPGVAGEYDKVKKDLIAVDALLAKIRAQSRADQSAAKPAAGPDPGAAAAAAEARDEALRAARAAAAKAAEDARKRALAELEKQFQTDEKRRFDAMVKDETMLADARLQLLKDSGQTLQATMIELQAKYGVTLERMIADGRTAGVEIIQKLFDVEAAKAQLDELQKQVDRIFADMARQESSIRTQQAAGLIGELTARQQIVDLYRATADQVDRLTPKMADLAGAINNPQAIDHVKDLQVQVANLRVSADATAQAIRASFEQGLGRAIDSLVDGTAKLQDAVRAFFAEIVRGLAQLATQRFVASLADSGSGFFAAAAKLLGGSYATGGPVYGPGTATSDSVLIAASDGEYVQRTAAVRHYGVAFMEAVNSLRFPRFATGGMVAAPTAAPAPAWHFAGGGLVPGAGAPAAAPLALRIVNVVDPQTTLDAMASSAGERVILNAITRNARSVKQALS